VPVIQEDMVSSAIRTEYGGGKAREYCGESGGDMGVRQESGPEALRGLTRVQRPPIAPRLG
jgi:hypothetical protein